VLDVTVGRAVVLGVGNILNRDEGLGVHAVGMLRDRLGDRESLECVDGGVLGLNLLSLVEACEHLLVLDAVDRGAAPGTPVEVPGEEIALFSGVKMSQHQITFQEVLGLAAVRDRLPSHLHLLGVQPADLSIGLGMTPIVEAAVPAVLDRALEVLSEWGLLGETLPCA